MTATKHESSPPHSLGVMLVVAESVAEQPDQFNLSWEWYLKTGNRYKKCILYYLCYHSLLNANLIRMLMNGYRSLLAHVNEGISLKHANKDDQSGGG